MSLKDMSIEKLHGSENYHTWKFAMENLLAFSDFENCITDPVTENDVAKLRKAKAKIVLSVDESIYAHIQGEDSASSIWKKLASLYDDSGSMRKIGLLRKFVTTRLEESESMAEYIKQLTDTANRLNGIGFKVSEEWLGAIMLAGLTEDFKPFLMGIESSNSKITGEIIRSKLLDSDYANVKNTSAFFTKKKNENEFNKNISKINKNRIKCNSCGKKGHISNECRSKGKLKINDSKIAFSAENSCNNKNPNEWYIDSGASGHMTPNKSILVNFKKSQIKEITAANNQKMQVTGCGDAFIRINGKNVEIKNILLVPQLSANLLSVAQMIENGNSVVFMKNACKLYDNRNKLIVQIQSRSGVYKFKTELSSCMFANTPSSDLLVWHRRLAHLNYADLIKMKNDADTGISFVDNPGILSKCEVCYQGKQTRKPFKLAGTRAKSLLGLIHSDLCGPMENPSFSGAKYFLTFIDDFSRRVFVYFLNSKTEVLDKFKEFKRLAENQTGAKIKIVRTDNGTEYVGGFDTFCKNNGIIHQTSNTYTPEQNGLAERMNRTLIEKAKCMLFDAKLSKRFWAEAVNTAAYITNRIVNSAMDGQIPEVVWSGSKPDLSKLRIFGAPVMVLIPKHKRKKWDPKSIKLIFVGYSETVKGYRCIDPTTKRITISRNVAFMEPDADVTLTSIKVNTSECNIESQDEKAEISDEEIFEDTNNINEISEITISDDNDPTYVPDITVDEPETIRRSERIANNNQPQTINNLHNIFQSNIANLAITDHLNFDPVTPEEALDKSDGNSWKIAMKSELESLAENKTWSITSLPPNRKAIKSKWVFKTKRDKNNEIIRYKARLVAKGCSQKYGIDYNETFSPVVRYTSIRFLIALSVKFKMNINQMDAVTAFLQGDLSEEIYMKLPSGCGADSGKICRLNRAIYGLKQSGRQWNLKLDNTLKSFGLIKSKVDPCVYFTSETDLILAIYVDDLLIFWKNKDSCEKLKSLLSNAFKMKDMGVARSCIGLNISYEKGGIALDQSNYILEILNKFKTMDCKPVATLSDYNQKLSLTMSENEVDVPYQEVVGSLLYLAQSTRPDIAFAVNDVSRFNKKHGQAHWAAVKRILRYIKGTINYKIFYFSSQELVGYSDADWASDIDKRRSCTGYVFTLSGGAISWGSKRQATIALSTTEAEYMALSAAVQEALWLKQFGQDFDKIIEKQAITIGCDNQSALSLALSDGFKARSKHIDIRHHFIREKIINNTIKLKYIPTGEMVADNLTKAVPSLKNIFCCNAMSVKEI